MKKEPPPMVCIVSFSFYFSTMGVCYCCVRGCSMNSSVMNISLFRFPKDHERCLTWAKNCKRAELGNLTLDRIHNNYKVCSLHFEAEMFSSLLKNRLKKNAMPTIFNWSMQSDEPVEAEENRNSGKNAEDNPSTIVLPPISHLTEDLNTNTTSNCNLSSEITHNAEESVLHLMETTSLRCRTCFEIIDSQRYFLMIMGHLTKTIKEMIIFCVPQMASSLSDNDVVCNKCLLALQFCVDFIENCLKTEENFNNIDCKESITICENDPASTSVHENLDHDYVQKIEPNETESLQNFKGPSTVLVDNQDGVTGSNSGQNERKNSGGESLEEPHQTQFVCCGNYFKTKDNLIVHIREMHNIASNIIEESDTEVPIKLEPELNENDESITSNPKAQCDEELPGKKKSRKIDLTVTCVYCYEFIEVSKMEAHLKEHNQREPKKTRSKKIRKPFTPTYKCKFCIERFTSWTDLNEHINNVHHPWNCYCGKQFIDESSLISHKAVHDNTDSFICEICGKMYKDKQYLSYHLKTHEEQSFSCSKCSKSFKTKRHLCVHVKNVHSTVYRCQCSQCGMVFKTRTALRNHISLKHSPKYTHTCNICGKKFTRGDYFMRHMNRHGIVTHTPGMDKHGEETGEKIFRRTRQKYNLKKVSSLLQCKYCSKFFTTVHKLRAHALTHVKRMRYKCKICSISFATSSGRWRHEKRHDDPTFELSCKICWSRMETKEDLDKHMVKHEKSKKYKCQYCGEAFVRKYMLDHHISEKHTTIEELEKEKRDILSEALGGLIHLFSDDENAE